MPVIAGCPNEVRIGQRHNAEPLRENHILFLQIRPRLQIEILCGGPNISAVSRGPSDAERLMPTGVGPSLPIEAIPRLIDVIVDRMRVLLSA